MKIAITGANSSVGLNLLSHITGKTDNDVVAGVRSERAAATLPESSQIEPCIISYEDITGLTESLNGVHSVVHLAGILIENKGSDYATANIAATGAVVKAAQHAGVKHLVFISVVGADKNSPNRYFSSKGEAEQLVAQSGISATIIRTPILLGPGTAGADSMCWAASQPKAKLLGGGNYSMRPLDVDDLSTAILNSCTEARPGVSTHELVGPEPLPYCDLIRKLGKLMDNDVSIASVPIWSAKIGAAITSRLKGGGISPTVIDVITMNEVVERNADKDLGVTLTPLSKTLEKIIANKK